MMSSKAIYIILPSHAWFLINTALGYFARTKAFSLNSHHSSPPCCTRSKRVPVVQAESTDLMMNEIEDIARELWAERSIPSTTKNAHDMYDERDNTIEFIEGEKEFPLDNNEHYSQRYNYFRDAANEGCPKAQHSLGLLLWSGFGNVETNPEESAKYHAAAARQYHLDAIAVLGGCLRTGSGVQKRNVQLGLNLIDFSASMGNPSGINKKAALKEQNDDYEAAFELYRNCHRNGKANALTLFNLAWCYYHGEGTVKDREKGLLLWKDATKMAPDEGSEEAAYFIHEHLVRDNPTEAEKWLQLSRDLGLNN